MTVTQQDLDDAVAAASASALDAETCAAAALTSSNNAASFASVAGSIASFIQSLCSNSVSPSGGGLPAGTIIAFSAMTLPDGFLNCNGAAISRTTYADLFAVIGIQYGNGDGINTFNLPDLRGEFLRGWDNGRGVDVDRAFGSGQGDAIRNITAAIGANGGATSAGRMEGAIYGTDGYPSANGIGGNAGNNGTLHFDASRVVPTGPENRPRNVAINYCIKF